MSERGAELEMLRATLEETLVRSSPPYELDISIGPHDLLGLGPHDLEVAADAWTLRFHEWPTGSAWLALDDEPEENATAAEVRRSRSAVMPARTERALAEADGRLDHAISRALLRSGDRVTLDLAAVLGDGTTAEDG